MARIGSAGAMPSATLDAHLVGTYMLAFNERTVPEQAFERKASLLLLLWLLITPEHRLVRERVLGRLWPDAAEPESSLVSALKSLRRAIGAAAGVPPLVQRDGRVVDTQPTYRAAAWTLTASPLPHRRGWHNLRN